MATDTLRVTHLGPWPASAEKMGQQHSVLSEEDNIEALSTNLDDRVVNPNCLELNFEYIPADALDQLITARSVHDCVGSLLTTTCAYDDAETIVRQAKKTFASLIMSGCESVAFDLIILEGMTDEYLPLRRDGTTVVGIGPDGHKKTFRAFAGLRKRQFFDSFCNMQWRTLAPVLGDDLHHQVLRPKQPLPLRGWEVIARGTDNCVVRSSLHPAHYHYNSTLVTPDHSPYTKQPFLNVAIKKLLQKAHFDHEQDVLVKTRGLDNPHLIKHIATYEVDREDGGEYYIVFPWADGGDLCNFWESMSKAARTPELLVWCLEQMLGIATAIQQLHQGFQGKTNCRHGDLKPRNIFHFTEGRAGKADNSSAPLGNLVIADLGISRIHDNPTFERDQITGTNATTPAYEPPEALSIVRRNSRGESVVDEDNNTTGGTRGKPWSRKYDMWSLGCIFLEFAIWLFHDIEGLNGFGEQRGEGHFYVVRYEDDNGEAGSGGGGADGGSSAVLCPKVKEAMDAVREDERRCSAGTKETGVGPLGRLVDLIEDQLLVIESEARCDAHKLVEVMNGIVHTAKQDPVGYFGGMLNKDLMDTQVPDVFRPRRGSRGSGV